MSHFGHHAYVGEERRVSSWLIAMFHSELASVMNKFREKESNIRCVVSTIAFGMGVQIGDVGLVMHWGPSKTRLAYWEEIGRCGRDGRKAHAYLYVFPDSIDKRIIDANMLSIVENSCYRSAPEFRLWDTFLSRVCLIRTYNN